MTCIRRLILLALILALALPALLATAGCSSEKPKYERTTCWFDTTGDINIECGYLTVPEDHAKPEGKKLRLAVAVFKSVADKPAADPVVYLEGGPGGSPLRSLVDYFADSLGPLLEKRDVILLDQRGTGYSQPALDCPEVLQVEIANLKEVLSADAENKRYEQAVLACHSRLADEGVKFAVYSTTQNAADVEDLRRALGYSSWNLYGTSYGTKLALTVLRDFPGGVRSAVIDSVFPLQVNFVSETPGNIVRAFDLLFESCAADAKCNAAYPDLKRVFLQLAAKLDTTPASVEIAVPSGETITALMDGDVFMGGLTLGLYITSALPELPRIIYQVKAGNYDLMATLLEAMLDSDKDMSQGMQYSVHCAEELPFDSAQALTAALAKIPDYRTFFRSDDRDPEQAFRVCAQWGTNPPKEIENQPVSSSVPTLLISGQLDPVTPPSWAALAARTLGKSQSIELPGAGHAPSMTEPCPQSLVSQFLDNPQSPLSDSCVRAQKKLAFYVPGNPSDIKLIQFEDKAQGIKGLKPEGWQETQRNPGVFFRQTSDLDPTAVAVFAIKASSSSQVLSRMEASLTAAGGKPTEKTGTRQAHGIQWTLYKITARGTVVDMALAETGQVTLMVMMTSESTEQPALLQAVLLPIIDSVEMLP